MKTIVIAGPTASGKSSLALMLAVKHRGEIICADSRQFYAHMAIGTARPTKEDVRKVPHHGYGILDPKSEKMDAGFFVRFAKEKIKEIQSRGNRPILVGGTGLYLRALYYGIKDVPARDEKISEHLQLRAEKEGIVSLYNELGTIDKKTAKNLSLNDDYRIMRALEIYYITKTPPSELRMSFALGKPEISAHWIYKKPKFDELKISIEKRVREMFAHGLTEEALSLRNYLPTGHWALEVMGYREALQFIDNKITLEEAIEKTFISHRQYAKRQYTWFNKEPFYRYKVL